MALPRDGIGQLRCITLGQRDFILAYAGRFESVTSNCAGPASQLASNAARGSVPGDRTIVAREGQEAPIVLEVRCRHRPEQPGQGARERFHGYKFSTLKRCTCVLMAILCFLDAVGDLQAGVPSGGSPITLFLFTLY